MEEERARPRIDWGNAGIRFEAISCESHNPKGGLAVSDFIMVGCDLHDRSMLLRIAEDRREPETRTYRTDRAAREKLVGDLQARARQSKGRVIFAYEACAQGYGLYDELQAAQIECYVLAPTHLPQSPGRNKRKCDAKDAQRILEIMRGHFLAGNDLPAVWVPDHPTRDDRELVRARIDASEKAVSLRTQIRCLLKRQTLAVPAAVGSSWTNKFRSWLEELAREESPLAVGAREGLHSLLLQLSLVEAEMVRLEQMVAQLASSSRYAESVRELMKFKGVGLWTAMVFLTEMGDLSRFQNRRQIGAYLGLVPSSKESGEQNDCKGHITHQGSYRVRQALCQAAWNRVRFDPAERQWYAQVVARNPKHKKIALVGAMRRLAICMWHAAQERGTPPPSRSPQGGERQPAPSAENHKNRRAPCKADARPRRSATRVAGRLTGPESVTDLS
jgi:transposase